MGCSGLLLLSSLWGELGAPEIERMWAPAIYAVHSYIKWFLSEVSEMQLPHVRILVISGCCCNCVHISFIYGVVIQVICEYVF